MTLVAGGRGVEQAAHLQLDPGTLSTLFNASPLAVVAVDRDALVRLWNPAAERMLGWRAEEMLGGELQCVPPDERQAFGEALDAVFAGESLMDVETVRLRKDGGRLPVSVSLAPWRTGDGRIVGAVGMVADISARKQAEAELLAHNHVLSALHETALRLAKHEGIGEDLRTIVAEAAALFDTTWGYLYLLEDDGQTLAIRIGLGAAKEYLGRTLRRGEGLAGRVLETGEGVVVDSYRTWPDRSTQFDDANLLVSAGVPLRAGDAVVGVLGVAFHAERQFDAADLELLQRFGDLASLALENARLNDELRERADELSALLASERSAGNALASVVDASPVAIVARNAEQRLTMWNPAAQQIFGWTADEVLGRPGPPMPEDERDRLGLLLAEVAVGRRLTDVEQVRTRKDGTTVAVSVSYAPVYDAEGRYTGSIGMARDIGERKLAAQAIRDAEEKYRTVVENIPAITYIDLADGSATTVYVSPQIETLLGISPHDWMEGDYDVWLDCIHPDDRGRARAAYLAATERREPLDVEYRAFSRDGSRRWFRDTASVVENGGGPGHLHGVMLDITALKDAQEELQTSYELLARTDEQRRRLLNKLVRAQEEERQRIAVDIHDDSIQVLTALTLRLELLRAGIADEGLCQALAEAEDIARRSITRLRELMFELRPPALDRDGLAASIRVRLEQIYEQHGLDCLVTDRLSREPDPDTRMILYRIVQEALVNVVKHAQASRVQVSLQTVDGGYRATVTDDGVGFDPLKPGDRIGHVGLDAMRERAEAAGGRSSITSAPGRGTSVEVFVPADLEAAA